MGIGYLPCQEKQSGKVKRYVGHCATLFSLEMPIDHSKQCINGLKIAPESGHAGYGIPRLQAGDIMHVVIPWRWVTWMRKTVDLHRRHTMGEDGEIPAYLFSRVGRRLNITTDNVYTDFSVFEFFNESQIVETLFKGFLPMTCCIVQIGKSSKISFHIEKV